MMKISDVKSKIHASMLWAKQNRLGIPKLCIKVTSRHVYKKYKEHQLIFCLDFGFMISSNENFLRY